jgi:hypothetical protein
MDDRHRLGRGGNDLGRGLAAITRRRGSIGEWILIHWQRLVQSSPVHLDTSRIQEIV